MMLGIGIGRELQDTILCLFVIRIGIGKTHIVDSDGNVLNLRANKVRAKLTLLRNSFTVGIEKTITPVTCHNIHIDPHAACNTDESISDIKT